MNTQSTQGQDPPVPTERWSIACGWCGILVSFDSLRWAVENFGGTDLLTDCPRCGVQETVSTAWEGNPTFHLTEQQQAAIPSRPVYEWRNGSWRPSDWVMIHTGERAEEVKQLAAELAARDGKFVYWDGDNLRAGDGVDLTIYLERAAQQDREEGWVP